MPAVRGTLQTEVASQAILAQLMTGQPQFTMGQTKVWFTSQKAEQDHDYDINPGYLKACCARPWSSFFSLESSARDFEDGDGRVFCMTEKGKKCACGLVESSRDL